MDFARILIVRLGAIGDVVHTLPALAALRRSFPRAHLAWAVERGGAAKLLAGNPSLDDLIELDLRGWRKDLTAAKTHQAIRSSVAQLRAARFDVTLDFQGLLKSAAVARLTGAPRRVGFARDVLREPASAWLLTEQVAADDREHVIKKNLQIAAHLGCDIGGAWEFPVALTAEEQQFAAAQDARFNNRFAILNPGGGWPTKLWNTHGFAQIADRLWNAYGISSAVAYGPGEETWAQAIVAQTKSRAAVVLKASLKEFWALAQRAQLFLGGDTGPMHIAAAAHTPIVAFFGPTSARRNGPFAAADVVIERDDLDCRTDCYRRRCSHTSCMKLPVDAVWQGVERRLRAAGATQRAGKRELPVLSF
jgi:heptosyltransferase I